MREALGVALEAHLPVLVEVLAVARHALVQDRVQPVPGQSWAIVAWPGAASGIEFHWPYTLAPTPPALA